MTGIRSQRRYGYFTVPLIGRLMGIRGNPVLNNTLAEYILDNTKRFESIIEIGAGPGALSGLLIKRFEHYIVLDKSGFALDVTRRLSPDIQPIHADIFDFYTRERFDAVISVDLAEHFQEKELHRLINKHIEIARDEGGIFICVRAYNSTDDEPVESSTGAPAGIAWNPRCEFKIAAWLKSYGIPFKKKYFDTIPMDRKRDRFIRAFNIILYRFFKINLERFYPKDRGRIVMFYIDKFTVGHSYYFEQQYY